MSSIIILTKNNIPVEFWEQKLSLAAHQILKIKSVKAVIKTAPQVIIIDAYFLGHQNLRWIEKQVQAIRALGYSKTLICLSPAYTSFKSKSNDDTVYRHHFNQSFIDRVSVSAVA